MMEYISGDVQQFYILILDFNLFGALHTAMHAVSCCKSRQAPHLNSAGRAHTAT